MENKMAIGFDTFATPSARVAVWAPNPDQDVPYALGAGLVIIICAFILVAAFGA